MKTRRNSMCWLGLMLTFGTLSFAVTTYAAKPSKPPSVPATYTGVPLGFTAYDLNNAGQVVGLVQIPGGPTSYSFQAVILNPLDTDGNGLPDTWFEDKDADGANDLVAGLGTAPGSFHTKATAINDLGVIAGISDDTAEAFVVVPQNGIWFQDANADGVNDFMVFLGSTPGREPGYLPYGVNINDSGEVIGWGVESDGTRRGFLVIPLELALGGKAWYRDDGSGANALMLDLGSFLPRGINDAGMVVGSQAGRATLRLADGTLVDLGAGVGPTDAVAINNGGPIGITYKVVEPVEHAGLLTPADANGDGRPDQWFRDLNGDGLNDLIVDIGAVQGLGGSVIADHGLNDAGSIVGDSWSTGGRYIGMKRASFLWENGLLQTLSSLTGGVTEFRNARAVNDARQIVCDAYILLPTR